MRIDCIGFWCRSQGNLVAIKHVNKKRIELTRQVLLELKHVSVLTLLMSFSRAAQTARAYLPLLKPLITGELALFNKKAEQSEDCGELH